MHAHDTDEGENEGARWLHDPPFGAPGDARCPECSATLDAPTLDYVACANDEEHSPIVWTCHECGHAWRCAWSCPDVSPEEWARYACPSCGAEPGGPCVDAEEGGRHVWSWDSASGNPPTRARPIPDAHRARVDVAFRELVAAEEAADR